MPTEIESNGSIGTANLLTANVQMNGQSSSSTDLDYFKLYNSGSGTSQFTVNLPNTYSNYYIKIYDNTGTLQKSYTAYNGSVTYSIPSTTAGYSYISVASFSTDDYSITGSFIADQVAYIPTYQLSTSLNSVDEGSTATFTLSTTNVTAGTSVPYTISGLSAADVVGGALSGSAVVNTSGQATITVALVADVLTEGAETLTLTAGGASASMTVNDTSKAVSPPTYSLTAASPTVNEGSAITFTLITTNLAAGTTIPYTLSGVTSADIIGGALSGTTTVGSNGQATINVLPSNDNLTEGTETLIVTAGGETAMTHIYDTSIAVAKPTYILFADAPSFNEGSIASFNLTTTNLPAGSTLTYTIEGVDSLDIVGGAISGTLTLNANGFATISIPLANDLKIEGTETLTLRIADAIARTFIYDTSKAVSPPTYALSAAAGSTNEGSTATFTLSTTNVTAGTSVPYTISGLSVADVVGGALSGSAVVNTSGQATITVALAADVLTEGAETLTLTAGGASASMTVNDTSTVQLTSLNSSVRNVYISGNYFFDTPSPQSITTDYRTENSFGYFKDKNSSVEWIGSNFKYSNGVFPSSGILNSLTVNNLDGSLKYGADNLSISIENLPKEFGLYDIVFNYNEPAYIYGTSGNDQLFGRNSGTYIFGGDGNDTLVVPVDYDSKKITIESDGFKTINFYDSEWNQKFTLDSIEFIQFNDKLIDIRLIKSQSNSTLTVNGGSSNDTLISTTANEAINGGAGLDTVVVNGNISNYSVVQTATGYTLTDKSGVNGTDTLTNIESIKFSDKTMNLLVQSKAANTAPDSVTSLVELYVSFFNRIPDADGMSFWLDEIKAGKTISQIAESFYAAGVNYSDLTGFSSQTTNTDFINVIYKNVLGRSGGADSGGLTFWNNELTSGRATKGTLVTDILESAHTFKGDATWGWVANLLDNKIEVAKKFSIDLGLNFNTPEESIKQGMTIASAITPSDTKTAISLISAPTVTLIPDTTPKIFLTPSSTSVNEGDLAKVFVSTSNIAANTALSFSISGVDTFSNVTTSRPQWDVSTLLTSNVILDFNGQGVLNIQTNADNVTEGSETMYVTIGNSTTSMIIKDTSITLVGVDTSGGGDIGGGGGGGDGGGGGGGDGY